jgi:hypothetical protein
MLYANGHVVRVGDRICFHGGLEGLVVCSIDDAEFSPNYPESAWAYLGRGILVNTDEAGLVHLAFAPPDLAKLSPGN